MNKEDVLDLIKTGEGLNLEFKESLSKELKKQIKFWTTILYRRGSKNVGKKKRLEIILDEIKEGIFNQRNFAKKIGVDNKTIERDVKELKNKIEFVGSKKGGYWKIK